MNINFKALEKNIVDFIQEQQLKIGFLEESVHLYYVLPSLNRILGLQDDGKGMLSHLQAFADYEKDSLGIISISQDANRFCLTIPPQGTAYIHALPLQDPFLPHLLSTLTNDHCTRADVTSLFYQYSDKVQAKEISSEDFDFLLYFTDRVPSSYYYCFKEEGCHLTYHRFTKEDYEDLFSS